MIRSLLLAALLVLPGLGFAETVRFPASDGLQVTAETGGSGAGPVIVLFHMAGASRGEYAQIAPELHRLGYRTLAVDQRSGGAFGGVVNETAAQVASDPGYAAAIPDLKAAAAYARAEMGAETVAVVGSSYSASLVLVLAGRDKGFADAVISFSPGEYFPDRSFVSEAAAGIAVPALLTAARSEMGRVEAIARAMRSDPVVFHPKGAGRHGATTLLTSDGAEYWEAIKAFLAAHLPAGQG